MIQALGSASRWKRLYMREIEKKAVTEAALQAAANRVYRLRVSTVQADRHHGCIVAHF